MNPFGNRASFISITTILLTMALFLQSAWSLFGQCKNRCENHRLKGNKKPYTLDCNAAYRTEQERYVCRRDCHFCPNYVCNETVDPNIFYCPSIEINGKCKIRCEATRPTGSSAWYFLNCEALYKTNDKLDFCRSDCTSCPLFVCNAPSDNNLYFCPSTEINEECVNRCNENRPAGSTESFSFQCSSSYNDSQTEIVHCQNDCSTCPSHICDDTVNNDQYFCPALNKSAESPTFLSLLKKLYRSE